MKWLLFLLIPFLASAADVPRLLYKPQLQSDINFSGFGGTNIAYLLDTNGSPIVGGSGGAFIPRSSGIATNLTVDLRGGQRLIFEGPNAGVDGFAFKWSSDRLVLTDRVNLATMEFNHGLSGYTHGNASSHTWTIDTLTGNATFSGAVTATNFIGLGTNSPSNGLILAASGDVAQWVPPVSTNGFVGQAQINSSSNALFGLFPTTNNFVTQANINSASNVLAMAQSNGTNDYVPTKLSAGLTNTFVRGVVPGTGVTTSTNSGVVTVNASGGGGDTFWVTNSGDHVISWLYNIEEGTGPVIFGDDGSGSLAHANITWAANGSISFAANNFTVSSVGTITGPSGIYSITSDGSASFASGAATIGASGYINALGVAGDGSSLTSLNASELVSGTVPDAQLSGASPTFGSITALSVISGNGSGITNLPTPTVTATNFVSGKFYTNSTGRTLLVHLSAGLTVAAVSGDATLDLMVDESGGHAGTLLDRVGMSTLITSIAMTYTNSLNGPVVSGGVYWITNNSTGTGNAATPVAGTGRIIKL